MANGSLSPVLSGIIVYPLKSAQGYQVDTWPLLSSGLKSDRRWMLIDGEGQCITQLSVPKLALVGAKLESASAIFSAPGCVPISCPFDVEDNSERVQITMEEGGRSFALLVRKDLDAWFSSFLGMECRIVRCPENLERKVDDVGDSLHFQKAFPLHLVSVASLDDLNSRLSTPVAMNRFRPNLTILGAAPHEDDGWKRIRIGEVVLRIDRACDHRCGVPNIEQETGQMGVEPLKTLGRYRRAQRGIYFGQNISIEKPGDICVGDGVEVIEFGEGPLENKVSENR